MEDFKSFVVISSDPYEDSICDFKNCDTIASVAEYIYAEIDEYERKDWIPYQTYTIIGINKDYTAEIFDTFLCDGQLNIFKPNTYIPFESPILARDGVIDYRI